MTKIRLNGTLDRTRGYITPSASDIMCPHFRKRFFEHGEIRERRAVCEMTEGSAICDYRLVQPDGTPICARYVHWPQWEIIKDVNQDIDDSFSSLPYLTASEQQVQKKNGAGEPLYWDTTLVPPQETTEDTGQPVMISSREQWLTTTFVDTHERRFRINNGDIGWYHNV